MLITMSLETDQYIEMLVLSGRDAARWERKARDKSFSPALQDALRKKADKRLALYNTILVSAGRDAVTADELLETFRPLPGE